MRSSSSTTATAVAVAPGSLSSSGGGGDVVLLDNLPAKFTIGCDHLSFSTTKNPFPGIRDIPPGAHLFWVAPTDSTSARSGFWIVAVADPSGGGHRVHVKRWDAFHEVLCDGDGGGGGDDPAGINEGQRRLQQVLPSLAPYWFPTATAAAGSSSSSSSSRREEADDAVAVADANDDLPPAFRDKAAMWSQLTSAISPALLDSIVVDVGRQTGRRAAATAVTVETREWSVTSSDRVLGESRSSEEAKLYGDGDGDGDGNGEGAAGGSSSNGNGSSGSGSNTDFLSSHQQLRFTFRMDGPLFDPSAEGPERTRQALDPTAWILGVLSSSSSSSSSSISTSTPTSTSTYLPPDAKNNNNNNHSSKATINKDDDNDNKLLGELQFAFLTGAHLGNFSCLEQWHFLVNKLVFRAHGLAAARPRLARDLIRTFHAQLAYADRFLENGGGVDVLDMVSADGKAAHAMEKTLVTYKGRLEEVLGGRRRVDGGGGGGGGGGEDEEEMMDAVGQAFAALETWLRRRRGWDLRADSYLRVGDVMLEDGEVVQAEREDFEDEDERGEFAPVVVGLDELGRQADLVSWD
ncbi:putative aar2 protein [Eutypa lata UCREL1]|uniref:Putative aar2 protein n=1 Tax=Eutypa lata (strain UCR-EL1) TaxID=1287681 RepID=M7SF12_EUTLA|nr:putative aar2 protein [Eutypa lata UCREL1]